ncbi:MAG: aspartate aminotransferase family protein [Candidatus Rokubacteria bacterium 13_1_40CM_69_27]|nr:MAG: aspartate aminotransferase family protein [Candidatus Rokubacteria bacterium 13_1_40CM_69_27]OLC30257.1 MAG: aspartate aminotransferase family protein [Candidatus Rokubacteria bacterium 13_1_40CM_4_69_5]
MALTAAELIKADQEHLIHPLHHPVDNAEPMIYVRGRGATIEDIGGRQYIDGLSGLWNVNVGHGRAELADAAAAQMKDLAYFSGYVGSSSIPAITLASRLVELAGDVHAVFFASGGAEANESAFKTARFYWKALGKPGKVKIIARQQGYHGVTLQAMSATGMAAYWKMFEPRVPGFVHIQTCYPYRFQGARPGETVGQAAARELEEAILREGPDTVAAFIAEPIHGGGGVIYPTDDYFPLVRQICTKHEVLFIADEVITGFCRTGRWFATGHWNVRPDIRAFAKGVTSGYLPLGGIMVTRAIKDAMDSVKPEDRWMHAYTYSGHPTCCAVALANIDIMERERLGENAAKMGARLHDGLRAAFGDHPHVGDIRGGKGLLAALELVEDRATKKNFPADRKVAPRLQAEMMKRGMVTRTRAVGGPHPAPGDTVYYAPPLVVTAAEVDRIVEITREAVRAVLGA